MKTILIIIGVATYLIVLLCTIAYNTSEEYQGNRKLSIFFDLPWPISYPLLMLYVWIVNFIRSL
mgnify:CR=1 FL=1